MSFLTWTNVARNTFMFALFACTCNRRFLFTSLRFFCRCCFSTLRLQRMCFAQRGSGQTMSSTGSVRLVSVGLLRYLLVHSCESSTMANVVDWVMIGGSGVLVETMGSMVADGSVVRAVGLVVEEVVVTGMLPSHACKSISTKGRALNSTRHLMFCSSTLS